jgi:hypothetical protein
MSEKRALGMGVYQLVCSVVDSRCTHHFPSPFGFLTFASGQGRAKPLVLFVHVQFRLPFVHKDPSALLVCNLPGNATTVVL